MFWYTLKRIGLIFPTLLVVSLLTFGLNQCTPGDPVINRMPEENTLSSRLETWQVYRKNYRIAAHSIGRDLPLFYFSISSQAYPDTLHRLVPLTEKENTKLLIGQYGNWPAVQSYLQQLQSSIQLVLDLQDDHQNDLIIEVSQKLQTLSLVHEEQEIHQALTRIAETVRQDSVMQADVGGSINHLTATYQALITQQQNWKHYLPAIHWHGWANQYHHWLARVARGDLGRSLRSAQDVGDKIKRAVKWTLQLNGVAILLAYLLAIPLGVYSALKAGSRFDRWLSLGLFVLFALPSFWTATMLSKFLTTSEWLNVFPSMGVGEVDPSSAWWEIFWVRAEHFFLPIFCVTYVSLAFLTRQVRANMIQVLQSDYIRTAYAKGLPQRVVLWRHAFPNALFPLITLLAGLLPRAIGGSVIIEQIFNIPGIGKLTIDSIRSADWPIVYGLLLLTAFLTILGILISDLLYAWADPRIQLSQSKKSANG